MEDTATLALTGFENSTGTSGANGGPEYGLTASMESDRINGFATGWVMSFTPPVVNIASGTVSTFANYHVVGTSANPQYVFSLRTTLTGGTGGYGLTSSDSNLVYNAGDGTYGSTDVFTISCDMINVYFYKTTTGTSGTTTLVGQGPYRPRETSFVILNIYRLPLGLTGLVSGSAVSNTNRAKFTNIRFYPSGRMGPGGTNTEAFVLKGTSAGIMQSYDGKDWIFANTSFTNVSQIAWNGNMWLAGQADSGNIDLAQTQQFPLLWSSDGLTWTATNPVLPLGNNSGVGGVAWGNGLWVAVGRGDTASIATSSDGRNWNAVTGSSSILGRGRAVAWNGNVFIATGNSSSGSPTTNRSLGTVPSNTGVSDMQVVTSFDGLTWTADTVPARMVVGRALASTRVGNSVVTILGGQGDSSIVTSSDSGFSGFTWTNPTLPSVNGYPITVNVNSISSAANTITIASNSVAVSNTVAFTARPSGSNIVPWNVYYVSSIANSTVGTTTIQISATNSSGGSPDVFSTFVLGGNSTVSAVQAKIGNTAFNRRGCFDFVWTGSQWYAGGESYPLSLGGDGTGNAAAGGSMTMTSSSFDASTWARATAATSAGPSLFQGAAWNGSVVSYAGNGAGAGNAVYSTPASGYNNGGQPPGTGVSYSVTARTVLPFTVPSLTGPVGQTVAAVTDSLTLRGENNGNITGSFDGMNTVTTFATNIFNNVNVGFGNIAWNGAVWLASGRTESNQTGLTSYFATSQDGRNWTRSTSLPFGSAMNGPIFITWCGVRWVATFGATNSHDSVVATSTDGLTWTAIPGTRALFDPSTLGYRPYLAGFDGNNTVLVSIAGGVKYALSRDSGLSWTVLDRPSGHNWAYTNMAWNGRVWLLGGDLSILFTSYDGINWNVGPEIVAGGENAPARTINRLLWTGTQWVAVNNNTTGSSKAVISTTSDPTALTGWTARVIATSTNVQDVTWNGAVLVATAITVGGAGFFYISRDGGSTWRQFGGNNGVGRSIASRIVLPILPNNLFLTELPYKIATNSTGGGLLTQSATLPATTFLNSPFAAVAASSTTTIDVVDPTIFLAGQRIYISAGNSGGSAVTPAGGYLVNNVNSQSRLAVTKDALGIAPSAGTGIPASSSVLTAVVQYAGQFPMYISPVAFFGSGQDNDLLITGADESLTRDMFYRNVAWGSGSNFSLITQFCRVYVSGVLDLTNCPDKGIRGISQLNGAVGVSGGAAATALPNVGSSVGFGGCRGSNGGSAATVAAGTAITRLGGLGMLGGRGGVGGAGGAGGSGTSGSVGGANSNDGPDGKSILNHGYMNAFTAYYNSGGTDQIVALYGGGGGTGGGTGGDGGGGYVGGPGGAGGYGGIPVIIYARTIIRPTTQRRCITSEGQQGGNGISGSDLAASNGYASPGGGGGGSGGGGGFVYLFYDNIIGSSVGNLQLSATGGSGGNGGAGRTSGGGFGASAAGNGGQGGAAGQILVISNNTGVVTYSNLNRPAQGSNAAAVAPSGSTGGVGQALTVSL